MCRKGSLIASMQSDIALDEHGGLRGVSDLNRYFADLRTAASNSWSIRAKERKRRWRILRKPNSQIGWRDKSSAVGRAAGGWFRGKLRAVSAVSLQALEPKSLGFSMLKAPSSDFLVCG
jgi:hypothetical protein